MIKILRDHFRRPSARQLMADQLDEAERQYTHECLELERAQHSVAMLKQRIKRLQSELGPQED